jgi:N4-gp56 family major capsid protein
MANAFTDTTAYANLVAAAYDRELRRALFAQPIFRQFVDTHPVDPTSTSNSITLTVTPELAALATTPLTEAVDPDSVAAPAPTRVTITLNEYGNVVLETFKLRESAFTSPDPTLAYLVGRNMVATIDKLVQNQLDAGTNILYKNGGAWKSQANGGTEVGVVSASDFLDAQGVAIASTLLRRRNARGRDGADQFVGIIHPDVAIDLMTQTGSSNGPTGFSWLNPHAYQDTQNIYAAEVGSFMGSRFVQSPNCATSLDGAASSKVYHSYVLGAEAIAEAVGVEPHVVIGLKVDKLMRFNPLGWLGFGGWSVFRQEAIELIRTGSSVQAQ